MSSPVCLLICVCLRGVRVAQGRFIPFRVFPQKAGLDSVSVSFSSAEGATLRLSFLIDSRALWGRTAVCFKVCVFGELKIEYWANRHGYIANQLWHDSREYCVCLWKRQDATLGNIKRETKGGFVPKSERLVRGVLQYFCFCYCWTENLSLKWREMMTQFLIKNLSQAKMNSISLTCTQTSREKVTKPTRFKFKNQHTGTAVDGTIWIYSLFVSCPMQSYTILNFTKDESAVVLHVFLTLGQHIPWKN